MHKLPFAMTLIGAVISIKAHSYEGTPSVKIIDSNKNFYCTAELLVENGNIYKEGLNHSATISFTNGMDNVLIKSKENITVYSYESFMKMPPNPYQIQEGIIGMTYYLKTDDNQTNIMDILSDGTVMIFGSSLGKKELLKFKCKNLKLNITIR